MKNITLALDEEIITAAREYARRHNLSLNSLISNLLNQTVTKNAHDWIEDCFSLMDQAQVPAGAKKWKREDLYRRG